MIELCHVSTLLLFLIVPAVILICQSPFYCLKLSAWFQARAESLEFFKQRKVEYYGQIHGQGKPAV